MPAKSKVEEIFQKKQQEIFPLLLKSLEENLPSLLSKSGIKNQETGIIPEESVKEFLSNIGKIQEVDQVSVVLSDSICSSLLSHSQTRTKTKNAKKLFKNAYKMSSIALKAYQSELEKLSALGQLTRFIGFEKPNINIQKIISQQIDEVVETSHPLAEPAINQSLKTQAINFLKDYLLELEKKLTVSELEIPTLAQLHEEKVRAFDIAYDQFSKKTKDSKVDIKQLTENLSSIFGLKTIPENEQVSLGFKTTEPQLPKGLTGTQIRLTLSPNKHKLETYYSLLSFNKDLFNKTLKSLELTVSNLKEKKSLDYKEEKTLFLSQRELNLLKNAQVLSMKNPKKAQRYQALFQNILSPSALTTASQFSWNLTRAVFGEFPGIYVPSENLLDDEYLSEKIVGGLIYGS